jgi:MFS family permease
MSSNTAITKNGMIRWQQLLGLATLQAAITLTWVVYNAYLVNLLAGFGFPAIWATYLLVIESLISVLLEPLMGWLSDRGQPSDPQQLDPTSVILLPLSGDQAHPREWLVGRFPFISVGVLLSAVLFLTIPLVATGSNPQTVAAWILPGVMIAWAFCMSIFQSPAMALIGQYASQTQLPQAASVLMMASIVIRVFSTSATQLILSWGPIAAFSIASASLMIALCLLRWFHPKAVQDAVQDEALASIEPLPVSQLSTHATLSKLRLAVIFLVGCGVGLASRSIGTMLGGKFLVPGVSLLLVWFVAQAVSLLPVGLWIDRMGVRRVLLGSLGIVALTLLTIFRHFNSPALLGLTIILGVAYSFVVNSTFPFALAQVPAARSGLGLGIYFSGAAMAGTMFGLMVQSIGKPTPEQAALLGCAGMIVAIIGVSSSFRGAPSPSCLAPSEEPYC